MVLSKVNTISTQSPVRVLCRLTTPLLTPLTVTTTAPPQHVKNPGEINGDRMTGVDAPAEKRL